MWSATTLAPSFSALEADVAAQLAPVRGIERSQLRTDWHRYAISRGTPAIGAPAVPWDRVEAGETLEADSRQPGRIVGVSMFDPRRQERSSARSVMRVTADAPTTC